MPSALAQASPFAGYPIYSSTELAASMQEDCPRPKAQSGLVLYPFCSRGQAVLVLLESTNIPKAPSSRNKAYLAYQAQQMRTLASYLLILVGGALKPLAQAPPSAADLSLSELRELIASNAANGLLAGIAGNLESGADLIWRSLRGEVDPQSWQKAADTLSTSQPGSIQHSLSLLSWVRRAIKDYLSIPAGLDVTATLSALAELKGVGLSPEVKLALVDAWPISPETTGSPSESVALSRYACIAEMDQFQVGFVNITCLNQNKYALEWKHPLPYKSFGQNYAEFSLSGFFRPETQLTQGYLSAAWGGTFKLRIPLPLVR